MPRSWRGWSFDGWRRDDGAVSEVVGYTLSFGILASVLVISMVTFQQSQEETIERVSELHAESVGQRVASAVVRATILVEERELTAYRHLVELDEQIESRDYTVALQDDSVTLTITGRDVTMSEPLFGAGQSVAFCPTTVPGGPLYISYGTPPAGLGCDDPSLDPSLYLEEA